METEVLIGETASTLLVVEKWREGMSDRSSSGVGQSSLNATEGTGASETVAVLDTVRLRFLTPSNWEVLPLREDGLCEDLRALPPVRRDSAIEGSEPWGFPGEC